MYAKDISKKIRSVKQDKQRRGLFVGGKAPYGYLLSPDKKNTLTIDGAAADIVRLIFNMALAGKSCREIAGILNERNIPPPAVYANLPRPRRSPYSGLWSSERIAYTLKNQMYIGNMVQGTTRRVNYKSKKSIRLPKEEWAVVEDTHPAIIEKPDFFKVQLLIDSRRSTRTRTHDYLLKGLIFCKECGYPLGVINRKLSGGRQSLYFICRTYQRFTKAGLCTCHCIAVEAVTNAVIELLRELCSRHIDREELRAAGIAILEEDGAKGGGKGAIRQISEELKNISANIDRLYSDKLRGVLEEGDFQRLYNKLKKDRGTLQDKLNICRIQPEKDTSEYDIDELIESFIQSIGKNRELLCSLIERIELTEEKEIHIYFSFYCLDIASEDLLKCTGSK